MKSNKSLTWIVQVDKWLSLSSRELKHVRQVRSKKMYKTDTVKKHGAVLNSVPWPKNWGNNEITDHQFIDHEMINHEIRADRAE